MPDWLIALLVAGMTGSGAWVTAKVTGRTGEHTRIRDLEKRLSRVEAINMLQWHYNRLLVDHIYEGKEPPPPPMPQALIDLLKE